MRSRYPWPLSALPPERAEALLSPTGAAAPSIPFVGLSRAGTADDYPRSDGNFVQPASMGVYVLCDLSSISVAGAMWDGGSSSGSNGWVSVRATAGGDFQAVVERLNNSVDVDALTPASGVLAPSWVWFEVTAGATGTGRFGVGDVGANENTTTHTQGIASGDIGDPSALFVYQLTGTSRSVAGDVVAIITDGFLSDADKDLVSADLTANGVASAAAVLSARIAASGTASLHEWIRPTASPVATAADLEDGADAGASPTLTSGTARLTGVAS